MTLSEALAAGDTIPDVGDEAERAIIDSDLEEEAVSEREIAPVIDVIELPQRTTRSGRLVKNPEGYRGVNSLQNGIFFMCIALTLIETHEVQKLDFW